MKTNKSKKEKSVKSDSLEGMLQVVFLTFSDGTVAPFTGKAVCPVGETRAIEKIQFGEPQKLPEGHRFEYLEKIS